MEKELLDTFEAAKKAADAASAGGRPSEEDRCVDALRRLRRIPVTTNDLVSTQVGKRLRYLAKHPRANIQAVASDLLEFWKNVVIEETSKGGKKNSTAEDKDTLKVKSERSETIAAKNISRSGSVKIEKYSRSENVKVEKMESDRQVKSDKVSTSVSAKVKVENKVSKSETVETEKGGKSEAIEIERNPKEENHTSGIKKPSSVPAGPPKLTSMVKCNDPIRDKLRELLSEAFSRVSSETSNDDREEVRNFVKEVDACDPIRVAVMVESVMFEKLGRSNGAQKVKYRSIMFNLKDGKNTDLRRRVLLGHVKPENLINMTPEEMASDERKQANKQIQEKALFECERGGAPKATTDQFKCGRCGQRKTTYYQLQTRSADEPMTTFVTCVNCNNHWKFC